MADPSISVIIPFLNMRRFLPDAVDSVRAQTEKDWELILVDDGSDDGGGELARKYAGDDPSRVRALPLSAQSAHGASAARNRGLAEARGDYIAFLDADDIWLPEKLGRQKKILQEHPEAAMTFARVHYFNDGPSQGEERDQPFTTLQERIYRPPELTVEFLRDANIYPCPTATLIRRSALREVGGFEEQFRKVRTDLAVWVKLSMHFPVCADSAVVARYRQHGASSVAEVFRDPDLYHRNEVAFYDWLLQYLGSFPAAVRRAPESIGCRRMFRLILAEVMQSGRQNALRWRWNVLRRAWRYPAFRREGRWIQMLMPGGSWGTREGR
jgi:glycosyltransferase involved in cell wall biosynthesis